MLRAGGGGAAEASAAAAGAQGLEWNDIWVCQGSFLTGFSCLYTASKPRAHHWVSRAQSNHCIFVSETWHEALQRQHWPGGWKSPGPSKCGGIFSSPSSSSSFLVEHAVHCLGCGRWFKGFAKRFHCYYMVVQLSKRLSFCGNSSHSKSG